MESGKICTKCNKYKILKYFNKDKQKADGLASWCKKCASKSSFQYHRGKGLKKYHISNNNYYNKLGAGVYLLTTKDGLRYVGQSSQIQRRRNSHKHLKGGVAYRLGLDYSEFTITVLETVNDKSLRLEREKYWIEKLDPELNKIFYSSK